MCELTSFAFATAVCISALLAFTTVKKYRTRAGLTTCILSLRPINEKAEQMKAEQMKSALANVNELPDAIRGCKYPAKQHNLKVKEHLLSKENTLSEQTTALFITGEKLENNKYCDTTREFRQNRYFYYLSGVDIPGCSLLFNFKTNALTLFLPNIEWDDVLWSGMPLSLEEAFEKFDVDEIVYCNEIEEKLKHDCFGFRIFTTDLDNVCPKLKDYLIAGDDSFFYAMDEARIIKDSYEIAIIRKATEITDVCHLAVMSALPIEINEIHIEAEFAYHATRQGARSLGYDPICCSGPACGTLHYIKNSEDLDKKASVLIDAGAEWRNYTSDVTRCFPISGKFTKEHREIYEAVLDVQSEVMKRIKAGVHWEDLHILSHKVLIKHLLELGIFKREYSEEEIFERKASCGFYPHGLGHLMGLDVHDVGGRPNYEDKNVYFQYLRMRRELQENMVITNEPGCYFNKYLIAEYLHKYPEREEVVDFNVVEKYMYVGGVRIEDDILVTKDGHENLTKITSDPKEIEKIVTDAISKGRAAFHVLA
ncbi:hypothetical protein HG535_0H01790 [Zygotorulaspora mrakii]|uniref:Aminopeptidase P N-terminal domain-containing protein n=1 Tax=Zygotorulaspora mrakii TaxID=42260 RepID=A0A7H9BAU3_ZYGMR|nr:uncharacterized protein HG535_0H01790 [Zygotorulaspora mrakii]QLG74852.1 hypothetical protein HG535_0H01790 [Zygotorulaspora mrakii]